MASGAPAKRPVKKRPPVKKPARKATRPRAIVPVTQSARYIRFLLHGDPGVGKTPFIATGGSRTLILEADPEGTVSAAVYGSSAEKWPVELWEDLEEASEWLRHGGTDDFDWCWLDSASLWQEKGLDQIMRELIASGKDHRKVYLPDKGEYGQNMNRLKLWVREMVKIPIHFGITAHTMRYENDEGTVVYMPAIQGNRMPEIICGYMNMVGHMTNRKLKDGSFERRIRVEKSSKYYARDRFNVIKGGVLINPTIPDLEEMVKARLTGRNTNGARKAPVKKTTTTPRRVR